MEQKGKSKLTQVLIIGSGIAFLAGSVLSLSGLIASSLNEPATSKNSAQSQNAQLQAEEKGFLGVLQREPNNQTALRGLVQIRLRRGDAPGTKTALEQLVKLNPDNKQYKELLAAIDKQVANTKNVGTLKTTQQQSGKK
jgi:cytochrome c-type biogenesis protein CcmH/NrfG